MLKTAHFAIALSLLLSLTPALDAAAKPGGSFSHGFSSHASSSHAPAPHAAPAAPKSGFGSFSRASSAPASTSSSAPAPSGPSGGFGSFGNASAAPRQSDSALSQQLSKQSSQAKALETLDQRNAAKAAQNTAQNAPQPVPGYASSNGAPPAGMQAPGAPTTVVVHQDGGGLGHVIAGAMIARSANAHAGYYPPGSGYNNGYNGGGNVGGGAHGGSSFLHLFVTLCLLAVIGWGLWFAWRGLRRRRAAQREADKPNYSFERN